MSTKTRDPWQALGSTHEQAVRAILDVWESADENALADGRTWYGIALGTAYDVSAIGGMSLQSAAAVIAHLSPRVSWSRNVSGALALAGGERPAGMMSANIERARKAIDAPDPLATFGPAAQKTAAFARNILGDEQAVTVDVWALRVAMLSPDSDLRGARYEAVADAYREAAHRAGVTPAVMQATTWVAIRGRSY